MAQRMFRPLAWLVLISVLLGSLPLAAPVAAAPEGAPSSRVDSAQIAPALEPPVPVAPLAAEPFNPAPGLALAIGLSPDPLTVGDTATLTVQITNRVPYPAENLVVTAPTPDGALAEAGPITINPVAGWRWDVGHLDGNASTVVTGTLRLVRMPAGEAIVASAEATADRVGTPARVQGGALAVDRTRGPADAAFTPGKSAKLRSQDGRVVVDLPANANARALTLRHTPNTGLGNNAPPDQPGLHRGLGQFTLTASDSAGNDVHQFDAPLTIAVSYTPEQLAARGIRDGDLGLFWFDETAQRWQLLHTEVDATNRVARATVDHFTPFQLSDLSSASTAYLPSLQGFQVSQFTGAATYRVPIETPAGAAGLKPALDLSYSSAASDGSGGDRDRWQAGWVGKGWSLGAEGYVARNTSVAGSAWDHFSLVFAGQSFDVVRGQLTNGCIDYSNTGALDCWTWHATDENFVRVRAVASGGDYIWKAWTQDGTRYDFTSVLYQQPDPNNTAIQSYKWLLTQATDTHGNKITYTYTVATAPVTSGTVHPSYHLNEILWGYDGTTPRYKAVFDTVDRATSNARGDTTQVDPNYEYPGYPTPNSYWEPATPHEMYRLDQIEIMSRQAATWELMWRYDLYYYSASDTTSPNINVNADSLNGQEVLTLKQVQRIGKDGSTALPATSFTYYARGIDQQIDAGGNRLKTVTNGQGGKLTFNYQRVWTAGSFGTEAAYYHENYHRVSQVTTESTVGIVTATATTYSYTNPARNDIGYAATVVHAAYPPSGNGESRPSLARPEKREFRGHATVTEKVYADTNIGGTPLRITVSSFYQGNGGTLTPPATCTPATTTVLGNVAVVETNPCYVAMREREAWKGRAYQVEVQTGGGVALQRTNHTFARIELPFFGSDSTVANAATQSNNYKRAGLWRVFTPEIKTEERILNSSGTAALKTTLTYYNAGCTTDDASSVTANYGNVGCVLEQDGTTTERKTTRGYRVLNDGTEFFVRQTQEAIYDDSSFLKALTNMLYDGGSTQSSTLTNGDLTRQMRYFDIPAGISSTNGITLHGTDTTYTYDALGNRLTETTYTGSSTRTFDGTTTTWSAVNGTARTTTYTYNDTTTTTVNEAYSGLPRTLQNPVNAEQIKATYDYRMQSLTSVIDLNNVTTLAEYDAFGRQIKLIKPGDSSANPTVKATYFDSATVFRYTIEQREVAGQAGVRVTQLYYDGLGRQIQTKRESVDNAENVIADMRYDALGRVIEQSQPRKVAQSGTSFTNYTSPGTFTNPNATTYDALGRPIRITAPDNTWTEHLYGVVNNQVYDDVIDANRHRTQQRTDVLGRRVQVYEVTGNCGTSVYSWAACPSVLISAETG